jgi:hypothetical protein
MPGLVGTGLAHYLVSRTLNDARTGSGGAEMKVNTKEMKAQNSKFWTILALCNVAAMTYPVRLYVQSDAGPSQLTAAIVMVGVAFFLAIADVISALMKTTA